MKRIKKIVIVSTLTILLAVLLALTTGLTCYIANTPVDTMYSTMLTICNVSYDEFKEIIVLLTGLIISSFALCVIIILEILNVIFLKKEQENDTKYIRW